MNKLPPYKVWANPEPAKARIAELEQQLAELREAAGELVANAEWDGDISTADTGDLKALRAELLQESSDE